MSSDIQLEVSMLIRDSRTNSGPISSDSSSFSATERPRKTKYYNAVRPRVKSPLYQHVGIIRYRTEGPNGGGDPVIIPQNIGLHVIEEDYPARRTAPPFQPLWPQDLFFPLTSFQEWKELEQEGIEATDELLTVGQILLAQDKKSRKCMCKPSPLRSSWTYL